MCTRPILTTVLLAGRRCCKTEKYYKLKISRFRLFGHRLHRTPRTYYNIDSHCKICGRTCSESGQIYRRNQRQSFKTVCSRVENSTILFTAYLWRSGHRNNIASRWSVYGWSFHSIRLRHPNLVFLDFIFGFLRPWVRILLL